MKHHPRGGGSTDQTDGDSLASWLHGLVPPSGLGRQGSAVIQAIVKEPETASYEGVVALAELAGVNVGTITRTAQSLGFSGWPALRREVRKRFLAYLGTAGTGSPSEPVAPALRAMSQDVDNLTAAVRGLDVGTLKRMALAMAQAGRTYLVAESTYGAIASALAQTARLAGYEAEAVTTGSLEIANRLAHIGTDGLVIIFAHWRYFKNAERTGRAAKARGARAFLVTDTRSPDASAWSEDTVRVPAEGPTFFPSLVPCLSVGQALVAELAALDPDRSATAIADAEAYWRRFGLVHWGG